MARRRFNDSERVALYLAAGGRCALCGAELAPGWHADHVTPWAAGGATDVINGQAVCPECNLRKGQRMPGEWTAPLRQWQVEALRAWRGRSGADFLLVATPGAGKTRAASRIVFDAMQTERVNRVIIVAPTRALRRHWMEDMAAYAGLQINGKFENGDAVLGEFYDGACVTYAAVGMNPAIYRKLCGETKHPTMVVLDECHHMGDEQTWGSACQYAFEPAIDRLNLSGTPFRTGNNPIAFAKYDCEGACIWDYAYSYGDALRDGVVRHLHFPTWDGRATWTEDGETPLTAEFKDTRSRREAQKHWVRLLDVRGDWLRSVLKKADEDLSFFRLTHPDAAGLVLAMGKNHAKAIARLIHGITGEIPTVVTSDDPDAPELIRAFRNSDTRWIVAIKMVSEGIDIPRLRCLVWATDCTTVLFVRQGIGRAVRKILGPDGKPCPDPQYANVYLPAHPALMAEAAKIKEEIRQVLREMEAIARSASERPETPSLLESVLSSEVTTEGVISDGTQIGSDSVRIAVELRDRHGIKMDTPALAVIVDIARNAPAAKPAPPPAARPQQPVILTDVLELKRKQLNGVVNQLLRVLEGQGVNRNHAEVYTCLADFLGDGLVQVKVHASPEALDRRIELVKRWISEAPYGRCPV